MGETFCSEHSNVMECLGKLEGKLDLIIEGQKEMKTDIRSITINGNAADTRSAVDRQKIAPVYWVILLIIAIVLEGAIQHLLKRWL